MTNATHKSQLNASGVKNMETTSETWVVFKDQI